MTMLPSLSPLSDVAPAGSGVAVPPPPFFRPPLGELRNVNVSWQDYERATGNSAAKVAGLRFEARVQRALGKRFQGYMPAPRVEFRDDSGYRVVRPDGLLPLRNRAVLFEIKHTHMPEAWWQLERLYRPLVEHWVAPIPVQVIEIVRTFDPQMPFPCPVELITKTLELWVSDPLALTKFGVFVWR